MHLWLAASAWMLLSFPFCHFLKECLLKAELDLICPRIDVITTLKVLCSETYVPISRRLLPLPLSYHRIATTS
ncbi:hypothetical protein F5Y03DRAFT_362846 [Xylaria venustula]|nr:hypothetical protein F5Y03DRAFT_362846 [Xylaria venustula]